MAIVPSQEAYKKDFSNYVAKATTLIHSPETTNAVMGMLDGPDPVQKVADATVMIMQRIDTAARQAGVEVQDSVKVFGANEIVRLIVELGEAAGKLKLAEKLIELALSVAVQDYVKAEIAAHRIDPQRLQVAIQADLRKLPPKDRKEIQAAQLRIQQTAKEYNNGKGMQQPTPDDEQAEGPQDEAQENEPPDQGMIQQPDPQQKGLIAGPQQKGLIAGGA